VRRDLNPGHLRTLPLSHAHHSASAVHWTYLTVLHATSVSLHAGIWTSSACREGFIWLFEFKNTAYCVQSSLCDDRCSIIAYWWSILLYSWVAKFLRKFNIQKFFAVCRFCIILFQWLMCNFVHVTAVLVCFILSKFHRSRASFNCSYSAHDNILRLWVCMPNDAITQ